MTSEVRGRLLYAAGEDSADMLYASGFNTPDPYLWYSVPGESGIVVNTMELGRALQEANRGLRVLNQNQAAEEWGLPKGKRAPHDFIFALARKHDVRLFEVPENFPYGLACQLRRRRLRLEAKPAFFPARARKSPEEVAKIRHGIQLSEVGFSRAEQVLRESRIEGDFLVWNNETLTAEIIRGEIDAEIARYGGTASHTITAPGVQGSDPHKAGSGPIHPHQPIVFDIFPRVDETGYCGDFTRTVLKGQAAPVVKCAFEAVREAQARALGAVAPGITGKAVHEIVTATFEELGFASNLESVPPSGFIHGTGHSLGLEVHDFGPGIHSRNDKPLEAGHVLTVEPGLYYPEWGGIRLEDVVVVTKEGNENLTTTPIYLEIP